MTSEHSEIVEAEGHLVDSDLLTAIFDKVIASGATFEVLHFELGATNEDFSQLRLKVMAPRAETLLDLVEELVALGCHPVRDEDALFRTADRDGCAPEDFYSTSNLRTAVRVNGAWIEVEDQRMDAVIVLEGGRARCRKLRQVRAGDRVACGLRGIRVTPEFRARDRLGFAFMTNEVSSERRVETAVARIAAMMREAKGRGERIAFVVGPVVVHTGGGPYLCELIRLGFVDAILAGNALAVHDVEAALFGTSLGVSLETGAAIEGGHRHHMRAINTIRRAGGLEAAVAQGVLRSGVMFECIRGGIPYTLAGSIRDDGPLPETVMDLFEAQDRYASLLADVQMVVVLSTMLHGIGVGNMLPAWVRMVCVDINPAVITKLADRGSSQTIGVVTDSGLFLHQLSQQIQAAGLTATNNTRSRA
ncbi:MAG TPA: TIGR00300 family protein [Vicinamibacterales bacterium]|nr:TIGR00300 family protein [Vicinamibacterales bacterium]